MTPEPSAIEARAPLHLCGAPIGSRTHVCAFFRTHEEEYAALVPFVAQGLMAGERAFLTVDPARQHEQMARLQAANIDVAEQGRRGALEVRNWHETHLKGGCFDADATLHYYGSVSQQGKERGFKRTRFVTHMGWSSEFLNGSEHMLAYEAQANNLWDEFRDAMDPVICSYDMSRFSAEVIVSAMQTHPIVLIGRMLQDNPFFREPAEFLQDLRDRRQSS